MKKKINKTMLLLSLFHLCAIFAFAGGNAGKAKLSIEAFDIKAGGEAEMLIDMSNPDDDITLVQFDLSLPQGLSVKKTGGEYDIDIAGRTSWKNHSLEANEIGYVVRFLLISTKNSIISGTSGAIISVKLQANSSFAGGDIIMKEILLVNPDGTTESKPSDYTYTIARKSNTYVTKIELNSYSQTLNVDSTFQLSPTVYPNDATDKSVTWTSSNTSVATVSSSGLVTAKSAGSATITCKANDGSGKSATCSVTVKGSSPDIIASGVDGGITWSLSKDGLLTLSGEGEMKDKEEWPWDKYKSNIFAVMIMSGIKSIGSFSFISCAHLSSVDIPNTVTKIGRHAFQNCDNLTSIKLPNSLKSIEDEAFAGCVSLESIYLPSSVDQLTIAPFGGCLNMTSINVDLNNQYYCSVDGVLFNKVKSIILEYPCGKSGGYVVPGSVEKIGEEAFRSCSKLSSIILNDGLAVIEAQAFENCSSLISVKIPNSVKNIAEYAFEYCM